MKKFTRCIGLFLIVLIANTPAIAQTSTPSHELFDRLLKKHVTITGRVDYKGFAKDSSDLNKYLKLLSLSPPDEKQWNRSEQMAFWINAYNAFTIKLINQYYPIKSIKDIGGSIQIPFVNTPWDIKFITIGNEKMDLNNIEHIKLRKKFHDPRLHMALVCASKSCPILLNEAYNAQRLDEQLTKQAKAFFSDSFRNKVSTDKAELSMIFKWYEMDFTRKGATVRSFVNTYSSIKLEPEAKISYLEYDWGLNEK